MARHIQMILGEPTIEAVPGTTLDSLLRRVATQYPDAVALADPPNRASFTDGEPHRLTYAETDRVVSAIAARLRSLGLITDAIIAVQLPNTVESVLVLLGVIRAGMIAAPLPLLWRRADAANALTRIGAKAIVTASRIGEHDACATAMQTAADVFSISHVCGFGDQLPDGVISLNSVFHQTEHRPLPSADREGNAATHVALVSFDVTPDGPIAVARNHAELIAGGAVVFQQGRIEPGACLLTCCAIGSFAGLALSAVPWLLSGGTLALHHPFGADVFAAQVQDERCDTVIVPGQLAHQLAQAGLFSGAGIKTILGVWRTPERLGTSPSWQHPITLTDILAFGETAIVALDRAADGQPSTLSGQTLTTPSGETVIEVARTTAGTLSLRGPMLPRQSFPPGAALAQIPHLKTDRQGFADTHYPCRIDPAAGTLTMTGPPPGVVSVGGYRFVRADLEDTVRIASGGAFITALPDALVGHRLAGISDGGDIGKQLANAGANPLLSGAFHRRPA